MERKKQKLYGNKAVLPGAVITAVFAAALYGISAPISKLLLRELPPTLMAALLYLGAGVGMLAVKYARRFRFQEQKEAKLTKQEMPYVIAMILLDIGAPILLMTGLLFTEPANVALLNNFEIVATASIALLLFKEAIGRRMWIAIGFISLSSIVLSLEGTRSLDFSIGSIFILLACCCWGFENNCTRMLSIKDPIQIVIIKGIGSGSGALIISIIIGQYSRHLPSILFALLVGFVAYGLSIYFYIKAQRVLGAARTSAYYATAPFIGVILSWIIFREGITLQFLIALVIMLLGSYFAVSEVHNHPHVHDLMTHEHKHNHTDGHHTHNHNQEVIGEHSHVHTHETIRHNHAHTPDTHHSHTHHTHTHHTHTHHTHTHLKQK
jgi:drug/metabolite transporter (DMT)-like permease